MKKFAFLLLSIGLFACSQNHHTFDNQDSPQFFGIIGGKATRSDHLVARSTVAIKLLTDKNTTFVCTGTLISLDTVLTAAHCIKQKASKLAVAFGVAMADEPFEPSRMRKAKSLKIHPRATPSRDNDVAIIKLENPAPTGFLPVAILDESVKLKIGMPMLLAGFGITDEKFNNVLSPFLMRVQVPLVAIVNDSILVTDQTTSQGACNGDSGGPAYYEDNNTLYVYGITSGTHNGATDCHHYGEYTYASYFISFIKKTVKDLGGVAPKIEKNLIIK